MSREEDEPWETQAAREAQGLVRQLVTRFEDGVDTEYVVQITGLTPEEELELKKHVQSGGRDGEEISFNLHAESRVVYEIPLVGGDGVEKFRFELPDATFVPEVAKKPWPKPGSGLSPAEKQRVETQLIKEKRREFVKKYKRWEARLEPFGARMGATYNQDPEWRADVAQGGEEKLYVPLNLRGDLSELKFDPSVKATYEGIPARRGSSCQMCRAGTACHLHRHTTGPSAAGAALLAAMAVAGATTSVEAGRSQAPAPVTMEDVVKILPSSREVASAILSIWVSDYDARLPSPSELVMDLAFAPNPTQASDEIQAPTPRILELQTRMITAYLGDLADEVLVGWDGRVVARSETEAGVRVGGLYVMMSLDRIVQKLGDDAAPAVAEVERFFTDLGDPDMGEVRIPRLKDMTKFEGIYEHHWKDIQANCSAMREWRELPAASLRRMEVREMRMLRGWRGTYGSQGEQDAVNAQVAADAEMAALRAKEQEFLLENQALIERYNSLDGKHEAQKALMNELLEKVRLQKAELAELAKIALEKQELLEALRKVNNDTRRFEVDTSILGLKLGTHSRRTEECKQMTQALLDYEPTSAVDFVTAYGTGGEVKKACDAAYKKIADTLEQVNQDVENLQRALTHAPIAERGNAYEDMIRVLAEREHLQNMTQTLVATNTTLMGLHTMNQTQPGLLEQYAQGAAQQMGAPKDLFASTVLGVLLSGDASFADFCTPGRCFDQILGGQSGLTPAEVEQVYQNVLAGWTDSLASGLLGSSESLKNAVRAGTLDAEMVRGFAMAANSTQLGGNLSNPNSVARTHSLMGLFKRQMREFRAEHATPTDYGVSVRPIDEATKTANYIIMAEEISLQRIFSHFVLEQVVKGKDYGEYLDSMYQPRVAKRMKERMKEMGGGKAAMEYTQLQVGQEEFLGTVSNSTREFSLGLPWYFTLVPTSLFLTAVSVGNSSDDLFTQLMGYVEKKTWQGTMIPTAMGAIGAAVGATGGDAAVHLVAHTVAQWKGVKLLQFFGLWYATPILTHNDNLGAVKRFRTDLANVVTMSQVALAGYKALSMQFVQYDDTLGPTQPPTFAGFTMYNMGSLYDRPVGRMWEAVVSGMGAGGAANVVGLGVAALVASPITGMVSAIGLSGAAAVAATGTALTAVQQSVSYTTVGLLNAAHVEGSAVSDAQKLMHELINAVKLGITSKPVDQAFLSALTFAYGFFQARQFMKDSSEMRKWRRRAAVGVGVVFGASSIACMIAGPEDVLVASVMKDMQGMSSGMQRQAYRAITDLMDEILRVKRGGRGLSEQEALFWLAASERGFSMTTSVIIDGAGAMKKIHAIVHAKWGFAIVALMSAFVALLTDVTPEAVSASSVALETRKRQPVQMMSPLRPGPSRETWSQMAWTVMTHAQQTGIQFFKGKPGRQRVSKVTPARNEPVPGRPASRRQQRQVQLATPPEVEDEEPPAGFRRRTRQLRIQDVTPKERRRPAPASVQRKRAESADLEGLGELYEPKERPARWTGPASSRVRRSSREPEPAPEPMRREEPKPAVRREPPPAPAQAKGTARRLAAYFEQQAKEG